MRYVTKGYKTWRWCFFCFVLAGLGGLLYRIGFIYPLPEDINLENVRHAHSHLMLFGWAVLLPLYFIKMDMTPGYHAAFSTKLMRASWWFTLIFSLLSFPSFFIWGYQPVALGESALPISAIISGLVMIGWYGFMIGYLITRQRKHKFIPNIWFDSAFFMLFISSFGAWGVGVAQMFNVGGPMFGQGLTHFFLSTFVEGWVILVLLGFITKALSIDFKTKKFSIPPGIVIGLIVLGAPLTFAFGISSSLFSENLMLAARTGGVSTALGVLIFAFMIHKKRRISGTIWLWPILFLVIKACLQIIAALVPSELWFSDHGIRIFYLHIVLLGAFTTGMIAFIVQSVKLSSWYSHIVLMTVIPVLLSLLLLTQFWPAQLSGVWIYLVLAITAVFPIAGLSVLWAKLKSRFKYHSKG